MLNKVPLEDQVCSPAQSVALGAEIDVEVKSYWVWEFQEGRDPQLWERSLVEDKTKCAPAFTETELNALLEAFNVTPSTVYITVRTKSDGAEVIFKGPSKSCSARAENVIAAKAALALELLKTKEAWCWT